ncbi:hypothetical protein GCT13_46140 [Paraburkholderia sp. CNPSo 3157]|uniref:Uncharacterized protein n=1 Tax=Paraburkholderia franconis TaxID=2654983 RepID=A0A7X1NLQ5_9BURK|nr:hypothetical protein [Paraburkholderia franconis]
MDIIDMARASGLTVVLDGRIGSEEYQSVCGSVSALLRFAETVCQSAANQSDLTSRCSTAANPSGRMRRCAIEGAGTSRARNASAQRMSRDTQQSVK